MNKYRAWEVFVGARLGLVRSMLADGALPSEIREVLEVNVDQVSEMCRDARIANTMAACAVKAGKYLSELRRKVEGAVA